MMYVQIRFPAISTEYLSLDAPKLLPGHSKLRQMTYEALAVKGVPPAKQASVELQVGVGLDMRFRGEVRRHG